MEDPVGPAPGQGAGTAPRPDPDHPFPIARGLEDLVAERPHLDPDHPRAAHPPGADFDLVIVGSGYGAAVVARQLAGCRPLDDPAGPPLSICLLERGQEYAAGAFPSRMADLAGHVRFSTADKPLPRGRRTGLFDLRLGGDLAALVANGVGGGSLINAGVMLAPRPEVLQQAHWPGALRQPGALDAHLDAVRPWLGATVDGRPNTVADSGEPLPTKTQALQRLGSSAQPVPITVALRPGTRTAAGVPLQPCIGCGDCATGCNHGAKHSLDIGLLAQVAHTPGVQLFTGATVLQLAPADPANAESGWLLQLQHTDAQLRRGQPRQFRLRARRVILAAGSLGSTEILLRSQRAGLALSPLLGRRFSANGDLITTLHDTKAPVQALADPLAAPAQRAVGPTITAMLDQRQGAAGHVLQDLAVPAPLRQLFDELFTTAATLQGLARADTGPHRPGDADPCAVDRAALARSLPLAMIGHDDAGGQLRLPAAPSDAQQDEGDGALQILWPGQRDDPRWAAQHLALARQAALPGGLGGQLLPNPAWQLLPPGLQQTLGLAHGPLLTVHPLGGCAMADSVASGVVDHIGRVFNPDAATGADRWHAGLVVLDGATVPGSLGINPALTIAALAHRGAEQLRQSWHLGPPRPANSALGPRPPWRQLPDPQQPPPVPHPTQVELVERLSGATRLADGRPAWLELQLVSLPTALAPLLQPQPPRAITLDGRHSRLRILARAPQRHSGAPADPADLLLTARLDGGLTLFHAEASAPLPRTLRATVHWLRNRGLRDITQGIADSLGQPAPAGQRLAAAGRMLRDTLILASHAGGVRRFDYQLQASQAQGPLAGLLPDGMRLAGAKRLHHGLAASPLQQLMELQLDPMPLLAAGERPLLCLDLADLARQGVPLLRLVGQQDQPSALADLAALAAYLARMLVRGQLWSFRLPDAPVSRTPQRLPGVVPGAPLPQVQELVVAQLPPPGGPGQGAGTPVCIRLTRYQPHDADRSRPPVLMIHGYSASGTTFAHPSVQPGLMPHLTGVHRRDVWLLDLRSSCGMPTATRDWAFEDMGCEDIPLAVHHICQATGALQVDIVAHCMGAAMLCMGLLGQQPGPLRSADGRPSALQMPRLGRHEQLRHQLWDRDLLCWDAASETSGSPAPGQQPRGRIRRLVLSQVGPALLLTPANTARAMLMRWAAPLLVDQPFAFTPAQPPGLAGQLLDRLLSALPYPPGEFERENPFWPPGQRLPWVGTRHRIDALFGRVFNLAGMDDATLTRLDDFFGPFNLNTVSQVMHFARHGQITDRSGFNRFIASHRLAQRLTFPMLSLHAAANGLADPGTADRLQALLANNLGPGGSLQTCQLPDPGLGHQDSLIGSERATRSTRLAIAGFLQRDDLP